MNAIARRVITALATAAVVVGLFLFCPLKALAPLVVVFSALVQLEFYQMVRAYAPAPRFGLALGTLYLILNAAIPGLDAFMDVAVYGALACAPTLFLFCVYVLLSPAFTRPLATIASTLFGFFYVPFLLSFFLRFAQLGLDESQTGLETFAMPDTRTGLYTLFALLAVTKLSDMGGFAFGLAFGKHKMCPSISPKKSWEGFAGSLLGSSLMALLFRWIAMRSDWAVDCVLWDHLTVLGAILLGCAVATCATLGDLIESRLKRECGVKDSATFMPAGMGGFLDMFDSILFMPALFYPLFYWFG